MRPKHKKDELEKTERRDRKTYEAPRLHEYGSLARLVRLAKGAASTDPMGGATKAGMS